MTSSSCLCSPTKASLYGAVLFTLQEAQWLPVSKSTLILVFTLFMATSKVVMTARHSHGSPFTLVESWVSHLLFGSPLGGSEEDHPHPPAAAPPSPPKTKEELSEGVRKRKAKKAE
ncbi:Trimeric intracellular cation channel type A [Liparis tanakae]|uniref:Trimeric intracellular cation channel type A n=1 Tax=Liparis tanakae TaxID=230148 RepID=A0A4Z2EIU9_9TELE|nr:Trimeric intracellular cation channel type A [Liparis tanakae]